MDANMAALNKSWNSSLANLRKAMGEGKMGKKYGKPDMSKAGMGGEAEEEEEDSEEEKEEIAKGKKKTKDGTTKAESSSQMQSDFTSPSSMVTAPDGGTGAGGGATNLGSEGMANVPIRKSLLDRMAESDNTVNVEPFLKSLVDNLDATNAETMQFVNGRMNAMQKSISDLSDLVKAQADFTVANAELTKSLSGDVESLRTAPLPRQGVVNVREGDTHERFQKSEGAPEPLQKSVVYEKMQELVKSGQMDLNTATKIEGRVERGQSLGEYETLFRS